MLSVLTLSLGCTDTLGWKNQWGDSCWTYTQRCRDGQFFAESWTQGKDYNFPEKNCCACGKDSVVETRQPAAPYPGAAAGGRTQRQSSRASQRCAARKALLAAKTAGRTGRRRNSRR